MRRSVAIQWHLIVDFPWVNTPESKRCYQKSLGKTSRLFNVFYCKHYLGQKSCQFTKVLILTYPSETNASPGVEIFWSDNIHLRKFHNYLLLDFEKTIPKRQIENFG